jgi:hypothetical protein
MFIFDQKTLTRVSAKQVQVVEITANLCCDGFQHNHIKHQEGRYGRYFTCFILRRRLVLPTIYAGMGKTFTPTRC